MKSWFYVVTCLAVPQIWAFVVVRAFALRARRQERAARLRAADPPRDFTI